MENNRKISKEDAENFCRSNHLTFLETSALKVINVREAFLSCARGLLQINFPEKYKNVDGGSRKKKCFCF